MTERLRNRLHCYGKPLPLTLEDQLGARTKLNWAYFNGALIVALVVGATLQSVCGFFVTLGILVAGQIAAGEIRFRKREP